jgi:hypothetical protein
MTREGIPVRIYDFGKVKMKPEDRQDPTMSVNIITIYKAFHGEFCANLTSVYDVCRAQDESVEVGRYHA